ncbi:hypothetical protein glysoja_035039 [Glycine soja]|uniref:DNA ligase ATP-dependent N-terminal domain-containing protein n=1 Tax=Glycine soja TaxID=3848 RepID=A0A0B2SR16_GLYSO|nr:hypothetical protein glysoja_035039 [Glycine soja]
MFLSHSLSALSLADVLPAVYLCNTKIGADHENKGDVAQECRQTHKSVVKHRLLATPTPLLIKDVFSALQKISVGSGSTSRKKGIIVHLMHSYCEKEMKFLVRTLVHRSFVGRKFTPFQGQGMLLLRLNNGIQ